MKCSIEEIAVRVGQSRLVRGLSNWRASFCCKNKDGTLTFSRSGGVLVILLVFLPAIVTGAFTLANSVNIPVWDDWERGVMLRKYYEQSPDFFAYMTAPHIDHRMVVPRILIIAMNELTGGNLRWEIALSFAFYTAGAACVFAVLKKTMGNTAWMLFTAFLVNAALFSPVQYQNFLWAVQIAMLLPFACLGLMLFAFRAEWRPVTRFVVVVACAWMGTHSFGHGLILWPVALLMGLWLPQIGAKKTRFVFSGGIALIGAATILAYFLWNFQNVTSHAYGQPPGETPPGVKNFAAAPGEIVDFVIAGMGNASGRLFPDVLVGAPILGKVTLGVLVAVLVGWAWILWRRRSRDDWEKILPWLAVAGFAVATMLAMALGRSIQGWEKAVMSRYAGPSVLLAAALIVLGGCLLHRWRESAPSPEGREFRNRWALGLALVWLGVQVPTWSHSLHKMTQWKLARLQQRAALVYLDHFTPKKVSRHDQTMEFAAEQARYLNQRDLLSPRLFEQPDFGGFTKNNTTLPESRADLLNASNVGNGIWVSGFATLRKPDRIADGVLITIRELGSDADETWTVVEMAEMETIYFQPNMALDNIFGGARNFYRPKYHAGWLELIPLDRMPSDHAVEIAFWAMDAENMRLQRLKRILKFDPETTTAGSNLMDSK